MSTRPAIAALAILMAACGDENPAPIEVDPRLDWQLVYVSGNWQEGVPGQALADPFVVQVHDGSGQPIAGAPVTWRRMTSGGTFIAEVVTRSDADGLARFSFVPAAVRVRLRADLDGQPTWKGIWFETAPSPLTVYERISPSSSCSEPVCEYLAFYGDHTFDLRYSSAFAFTGTYTRDGSEIRLQFSADSRWQAIGAIGGDSLRVSYTFEADMSGFEGGTFLLREGTPPLPAAFLNVIGGGTP